MSLTLSQPTKQFHDTYRLAIFTARAETLNRPIDHTVITAELQIPDPTTIPRETRTCHLYREVQNTSTFSKYCMDGRKQSVGLVPSRSIYPRAANSLRANAVEKFNKLWLLVVPCQKFCFFVSSSSRSKLRPFGKPPFLSAHPLSPRGSFGTRPKIPKNPNPRSLLFNLHTASSTRRYLCSVISDSILASPTRARGETHTPQSSSE